MSFANALSSAENVAEALYNIICPLLASKDCIKCISDEGGRIFTTDVICLMSHINIEHPVGELILQALEAHKKKHRTGSKTLLFLVSRITKVAYQLLSLGIPLNRSLTIIETCITKLIQDVGNISLPVTASADKQIHEKIFFQNADALVKSRKCMDQPIPQSHDKQSGEINNYSTDWQKNGRQDNSAEIIDPKITDDDDVEQCLHFSEADSVFLKMTFAQQPESEDDISWFFDNINGNSATELRNKPKQNCPNGILSTFEKSQSKTDFCQFLSKAKIKENECCSQFSFHYHPKSESSIQAKEEHDSDFEDCFDDDENRKHFSVTIEAPPTDPLFLHDKRSQDQLLLHNAKKHFLTHADFDCEGSSPLFDHRNIDKSNQIHGSESEDEFASCFTDVNLKSVNTSVLCMEGKNVEQTISVENYHHDHKEKGSAYQLSMISDRENSFTTNSNSKSPQQNAIDNSLSPIANAPVRARHDASVIGKLNEMLDSVRRCKSANTNFDKSLSRNTLTMQSNHGKTCGDRLNEFTTNNFSTHSTVNISKVEVHSKANTPREQLHHHDLLKTALPEKQNTLREKKSHQIAISSRHFSNSEANQQSASGFIRGPEIDPLLCHCSTELLLAGESSDNDKENSRHFQNVDERREFLKRSLNDGGVRTAPNISLCQNQKLLLPRDVGRLVDTELSKPVEQLLLHQMWDKEFTEFNLKLVDCVCASGLIPTSHGEENKYVTVLPGILLPCDWYILQQLSSPDNIGIKKALLLKADVTPFHHHKGYKSTLANKVLISTGLEGSCESDWTSSILETVKELGVNLLLVKGIVQDRLVDLLESAGVLVLSKLSYHTLSALAYVNKTDMITYVTDASMEHVCEIELQPLAENWVDCLEERSKLSKQFVKVVNSYEVQTVVLQYSNPVSASIAEEKLWSSLSCLSNAIKDKRVLPGAGITEAWCAEVLEREASLFLEADEGIQHTVLELMSQVFRHYSTVVQENVCSMQKQDLDSIFQPFPEKLSSSSNSFFTQNKAATSFKEKQNSMSLSFANMKKNNLENTGAIVHELQEIFEVEKNLTHSFDGLSCDSIKSNLFENNFCDLSAVNVYDNFASKIASWETAVHVVSVLSKLDSLVVTGIDMTSSDREYAVF